MIEIIEACKKLKVGEVVWIDFLHGLKLQEDGKTLKIVERFPGYDPLKHDPLTLSTRVKYE